MGVPLTGGTSQVIQHAPILVECKSDQVRVRTRGRVGQICSRQAPSAHLLGQLRAGHSDARVGSWCVARHHIDL